MKYLFILFVITLTACTSFKPNQIELSEVYDDGKFLYDYDKACWIATDSLLATKPDRIAMGYFFAKKQNNMWEVVFGRMSDDRSCFLIGYKVFLDENNNTDVQKMFPRQRDTNDYYKFALGLEQSFKDVVVPLRARRYNYYVQVRQDSILRYYFLPANNETNVYLLGDDEYIEYHYNDLRKLNQKRMHKSLLSFDVNVTDTKMTFSTAILTKIPTPSDVFFVLTKNPPIDHVVVAESYTYFIAKDKGILFMENSAARKFMMK